MVQTLTHLTETPSQTAGPYVHIGCIPSFAGLPDVYPHDLGLSPINDGAKGQIITITGSIQDATGWTLKDAMLESWQPDGAGYFPGHPDSDPEVRGFCRFVADNDTGEFTLRTVKPGKTPHRGGGFQAPHISLWIVARGINTGLQTRIYFSDEDNSADPLLSRIEHRPRVETLIATKTSGTEYRFDIRLQGDRETVFLDL